MDVPATMTASVEVSVGGYSGPAARLSFFWEQNNLWFFFMFFFFRFFHGSTGKYQEEIGISCDLVGLMGQKMGTPWDFHALSMGFLLISMGISLDIGLTMKSGTTVYQKMV